MDPAGSYPLHGEVEWIPAGEGGRSSGNPAGPVYATVGWRDSIGPDKGLASFVLRDFDPAQQRSSADARWLFQQAGVEFEVTAGDVIVVAEGLRPVARFYVGQVDDQATRWRHIESWLRSVLIEVDLAPADQGQVEEYLDHNELGLAFQAIVAALAERGTPVGPTVRRKLADAAADMELASDPHWRRLRDMPG